MEKKWVSQNITTPKASSNLRISRSSEPMTVRNTNAASTWEGFFICNCDNIFISVMGINFFYHKKGYKLNIYEYAHMKRNQEPKTLDETMHSSSSGRCIKAIVGNFVATCYVQAIIGIILIIP